MNKALGEYQSNAIARRLEHSVGGSSSMPIEKVPGSNPGRGTLLPALFGQCIAGVGCLFSLTHPLSLYRRQGPSGWCDKLVT